MNVRLRMYKYCYSNLGAIYAKGLLAFRLHAFTFIACELGEFKPLRIKLPDWLLQCAGNVMHHFNS